MALFGGKFLSLRWLMNFLLGLHFLGLSVALCLFIIGLSSLVGLGVFVVRSLSV